MLPMVGAARRAGPADFRRTLVLPSAQRPPSPAVTTPWQGLRRTARYLRHAPDRGPEGRRRRLSRVAAGQRRPDRRALPDLVRPDLERRPRPLGLAALPGRRRLQHHPDHPGWHHQRPLRARHISATSNDEVWPPPYRLQVYGAAEVGYVLEQDDRQLVPCRTAPGSASCRAPTCKPAASATCSPWTTGQPGITFVTGRRDASSLRLLSTAPVNTARHRSPERLLTNPDVAFADAARPLPRSSPKYLEPGGTATFPSAAGHRLLLGPSRRILPRTPSADEHDRAGAGEPSFVENRPLAGSSWGEVDHV